MRVSHWVVELESDYVHERELVGPFHTEAAARRFVEQQEPERSGDVVPVTAAWGFEGKEQG